MSRQETERAIQLRPELAAPYITRARIAAAQGDTQLATQNVQKALELEPRSAAANGALGDVYEAEDRNQNAIAAYRKAIDLAPDDWRWPVSLGIAEFNQGNLPESISQLQHGIQLAPDNAVAYFDLSLAHSQSNRLDEARKDLEKSLELEPTSRAFLALGSLQLFEGKYDVAAATYLKAIQFNRNDYKAWADLGNAYEWMGGRKTEALEAFRHAVQLQEAARIKRPQDAELLSSLAENLAALGNASAQPGVDPQASPWSQTIRSFSTGQARRSKNSVSGIKRFH